MATMFKNYFVLLIGLAVVTTFAVAMVTETELVRFHCSVDVCNQFGKPQFCSDNKRCINCEDKKVHCGTLQMPINCSDYCVARTCALPWSIQNGQIVSSHTSYGRVLPGDNITVTCDDGYNLIGDNQFKCKEGGQWQPNTSMPICKQSRGNGWRIAFIITVVALLAIVILCVRLVYLRMMRQRSGNFQTTSTEEADDENIPLTINTENDNSMGPETSNNDNSVHQVINVQNTILLHHQPDSASGGHKNETSNRANTLDPIDEKPGTQETKTAEEASDVPIRRSTDDTDLKSPVQQETVDELEETREGPTSSQSEGHGWVTEERGGDPNRKFALPDGIYDKNDIGLG